MSSSPCLRSMSGTIALFRNCGSRKLAALSAPSNYWLRSFSASMTSSAPAEAAGAPTQNQTPNRSHAKRPHEDAGGNRFKKFKGRKKSKRKEIKEGSSEEVLLHDIQSMVASLRVSGSSEKPDAAVAAQGDVPIPLPEPGSEIDVEVVDLSSTGDGLALQKGSKQIYVVPFVAVGDVVRVKVYRHMGEEYSITDLISVVTPSPRRDDSRIGCKYFASCSGCQFQMLDYAEQLRVKRTIVEKAYRNFSQLPPELVPAIGDTIGSPLQYGYRTKLTPHFDGPPGFRSRDKKAAFEERPAIGFMQKGARRTLDIEDCPIGTEAVRKGMKRERERMNREFGNYERGATILLRESTERHQKGAEGGDKSPPPPEKVPEDVVRIETDSHVEIKTCITDSNAATQEFVDDFVFTNPAGAFFQNNNSILPTFTSYIREHALPPVLAPAPTPDPTAASPPAPSPKQIKYLIDAYSGSGLFTITLSALFAGGSTGIDIADKSIAFARQNAALNHLPPSRCRFVAADAPQLFRDIAHLDPDETVVVLDPPRKGCDASFLTQLLRFGPRRVIYVSCNVHTQARDVGVLVRGEGEGVASNGAGDDVAKKTKTRYDIESLRGFDFFPQTGHVEGVAVLNRVD